MMPMKQGNNASPPDFTRRGFLVAMSAAGAAFGFPRVAQAAARFAASEEPSPLARQVFEPSLWYAIDGEGRVNINITRAEMGQHIGTALARILADELGANWDDVQITYVDHEKKWGGAPTAGSRSVWSMWSVYRQAGAAGRVALIEAAAQMWGIPAEDCSAEADIVTGGGNSITFAALVTEGLSRSFTQDELKALPLKPHSDFRLIGQDVAALDIADKTTGRALYGIDAEVDGMVYGVPLIPPTRQGSKVISIDDSEAKGQKGYLRTIDLQDPSGIVPGMVVVVGETLMAAKWASELITVEWEAGETATVSEDDIQALSRELIADENAGTLLDTGNFNTAPAFETAVDTLEAEYTTSTVLHFALEPMNATAFVNDGGQYEIHAGSQWPALMTDWAQRALGVGPDKVTMRTYMLGGGFGRRVFGDYVVAAALTTKALGGRPIKLVFFREDDSLIDCPRSPSVQKLRLAIDDNQAITAMEHSAAAGWPSYTVRTEADMAKGVNGKPYDTAAISGADHWYEVGAHRVRAIANHLASQTVRTGFLRSIAPGWTNFAVESFMDEAAHKLGVDPLEFRLAHLRGEGRNAGEGPHSVGGASRQAAVLRRVAELSGYGRTDIGPDTAIGIASTYGQEREMPTWNGTAVQLRVDRETGMVEVQKLWMVIDCGTVIDPDGARAQCEGAALWGLSMALYEGTKIVDGQVHDRNLGSYAPLRMIDTPEIEIELMESTHAPTGLGEPGVTGVAPAVANAIFNATGARLRHLPMTPDAILKALQT
ncbi:xanthine dehydrogenase family protein molybdopterin-binding subunit [Oricola thermophila]|uniref:Xanthine dehydrogenase family protein molybdopterin-binding subunit n=1 Tax=Oricola thermophila TaxID=2742145 RepID=A0A6N1VJD7_9HYPH|nr:molybdopterin cofactor-binding domain-containing protein [Oricola thermophila]QKV19007.1 xanthine dehydrogenase family protein molybdopterin-binding subunit [Oricola thermophila]